MKLAWQTKTVFEHEHVSERQHAGVERESGVNPLRDYLVPALPAHFLYSMTGFSHPDAGIVPEHHADPASGKHGAAFLDKQGNVAYNYNT